MTATFSRLTLRWTARTRLAHTLEPVPGFPTTDVGPDKRHRDAEYADAHGAKARRYRNKTRHKGGFHDV
jgi:hypothetical protein